MATQENGLESARGLEVEEAEEGDKRRRNKRQPLVNPMEAAVAHRGSKEGTQTTGQKKRGRPAKGSFTVTEDSDLLDQVAKRPVQVTTGHAVVNTATLFSDSTPKFHASNFVKIAYDPAQGGVTWFSGVHYQHGWSAKSTCRCRCSQAAVL